MNKINFRPSRLLLLGLLALSMNANAWVASRTVVGPHGGVAHTTAAGPSAGWYGHPVATAAAVTTAAVVTAAVVGSVVHSIPPSCSAVIVNGFTYQQCGSTWYQPQYVGTTVQYVVINPPR